MALTKIDDRGLKTPIDLLDNEKIRLGTGNDLELYHNGTRSEILNNTGDLVIQTSANNKLMLRAQTGESHFIGYHDGKVELYYDGSKKFETSTTGATLTGNLVLVNTSQSKILQDTSDGSDNKWLSINGGGDASQTRGGGITFFGNETTGHEGRINISAGNSGSVNGYINFTTGGAERGRFDSSGRLLLGTTTEGEGSADNLTIADSGACGITIRSGTSDNGQIFFSDGTSGDDEYRGMIAYQHSSNQFLFKTNTTLALTLDSSQNATFAGTVKVGSNSAPSLLESSTGGGGTEDIFRVGLNRTNTSTSDKQIWSEYTVSSSLSNFAIYARPANDTGTAGLKFKVDAVTGTVSDSKGNLRSVIINNQQGSAYTLVASDAGKCIRMNSDSVTFNDNVFSAGDVVTILNHSASDITLTQGSGFALYDSGTATNGNKTLAGRGLATFIFIAADTCYGSGAGLS